ncbi:hypothetical protein [Streptosporangium subroseum]|uniref:hypothetical protein n=1 Tax=Streptosporangium subroseum TaxID=106412 RepID=UPI003084AA38|nr:hypothetical protein OHB15_21425 [Streptosporangium subroseum]
MNAHPTPPLIIHLAGEAGVELEGAVDHLHVAGVLEAIQRQVQPVVQPPRVLPQADLGAGAPSLW